jgi:hypothetical protein
MSRDATIIRNHNSSNKLAESCAPAGRRHDAAIEDASKNPGVQRHWKQQSRFDQKCPVAIKPRRTGHEEREPAADHYDEAEPLERQQLA